MATASVVLQLTNQASPQLRSVTADTSALERQASATTSAVRNQALALNLLDPAQRRAALAATDHAGRVTILRSALEATDRDSRGFYQTLGQLATAEQRAAREADQLAAAQNRASLSAQFTGSLKEGLLGIVGPAALAAGAIAAVGGAITGVADAARDALSLQQTSAGLRIAAGSAQTYADALEIARRNQVLFGGTVEENRAALIGLANISRTSGVALTSIDEVVRQLKASDPAATFEDASIALREFLSGDITSLAERFELPRSALRELADESVSSEEKLRRLGEMLLQAGYSADTAAEAVPKATREINTLGVDADRVRLAVGGLVGQLAGLAAQSANSDGRITKFADSVEQGGAIVSEMLRRVGEGESYLEAFQNAVRAAAGDMGKVPGTAGAASEATGRFGKSARSAAGDVNSLANAVDRLNKTSAGKALPGAGKSALSRPLGANLPTTGVGLSAFQSPDEAKGGGGGGRVSGAQSTALQLIDIERNAAAAREQIIRDSNQRIADMQLDFELRQTRSAEDFERRKRRLLAEGKIFEARQAQEEFDRQRRRDQEDYQIARTRAERDAGERLGDREAAADRRVDSVTARAGGGALPASPTTGGGGDALPLALPSAGGGATVIVEFQPLQLLLDGQVLTEVLYPRIAQKLDADIVRVYATAPPQIGPGAGAAGGRP